MRHHILDLALLMCSMLGHSEPRPSFGMTPTFQRILKSRCHTKRRMTTTQVIRDQFVYCSPLLVWTYLMCHHISDLVLWESSKLGHSELMVQNNTSSEGWSNWPSHPARPPSANRGRSHTQVYCYSLHQKKVYTFAELSSQNWGGPDER